jgi:hypothetical protein
MPRRRFGKVRAGVALVRGLQPLGPTDHHEMQASAAAALGDPADILERHRIDPVVAVAM